MGARRFQGGAGSGINVVMPAQEAGIMIAQTGGSRGIKGDPALGQQIGKDLRMVVDFEVSAEVGVILLQGVVAVRTGGDDLS